MALERGFRIESKVAIFRQWHSKEYFPWAGLLVDEEHYTITGEYVEDPVAILRYSPESYNRLEPRWEAAF